MVTVSKLSAVWLSKYSEVFTETNEAECLCSGQTERRADIQKNMSICLEGSGVYQGT